MPQTTESLDPENMKKKTYVFIGPFLRSRRQRGGLRRRGRQQVLRLYFQLQSALARADVNKIPAQAVLVNKSGEMFFHIFWVQRLCCLWHIFFKVIVEGLNFTSQSQRGT